VGRIAEMQPDSRTWHDSPSSSRRGSRQQGGAGVPDYRPLGLGCAVLRLINRTISAQLTARALQLLRPFQSAVAVRDAEAAAGGLDGGKSRVEGVDGMDALFFFLDASQTPLAPCRAAR
jgi:hypothetical protein